MISHDINSFKSALPHRGKLLAIDLGTRFMGIALSDQERIIASARASIERENKRKDIGRLHSLITEEQVVGIVLGYPLTLQGEEGEACEQVMQFAKHVLKRSDLPIFLQDERYSTKAAQQVLKDTHSLQKMQQQAMDDKIAAAWLLQIVLDRLSSV